MKNRVLQFGDGKLYFTHKALPKGISLTFSNKLYTYFNTFITRKQDVININLMYLFGRKIGLRAFQP